MMQSDPATCYLGMGGNMGDVLQAMQQALDALNKTRQVSVTAVSPVYVTAPWGVTEQPDFLNCCSAIQTTLSPHQLMDHILHIEAEGGRIREMKWGPRTLDIDILTYGDQTIEDVRLTVPHPRMLERIFVMKPLADIAPDLVLEGQSAIARVNAMPEDGIAKFGRSLKLPGS